MAQVIRFGHRRQPLLSARNLVLLVAVGAAIFALTVSYRDQLGELTASYKPEPRTPARPIANSGPTIVKLGVPPPAPLEGPIDARRITVVDSDTIRIEGQGFRLVGFETPEKGLQAKCAAEREKAAQATRRLRDIVAGGALKFERVACACEGGTEGTLRCNDGRLCGVLSAAGRDVSDILIGEGLARPYVCGRTKCPAKQPWC